MQETTTKRTTTVEGTAHILGISRAAAYEGVRRGFIPAIRVSPRRLVVSLDAIEKLLAGNEKK